MMLLPQSAVGAALLTVTCPFVMPVDIMAAWEFESWTFDSWIWATPLEAARKLKLYKSPSPVAEMLRLAQPTLLIDPAAVTGVTQNVSTVPL
jgi:hypothetical protein